jgi:hypothetical protein
MLEGVDEVLADIAVQRERRRNVLFYKNVEVKDGYGQTNEESRLSNSSKKNSGKDRYLVTINYDEPDEYKHALERIADLSHPKVKAWNTQWDEDMDIRREADEIHEKQVSFHHT